MGGVVRLSSASCLTLQSSGVTVFFTGNYFHSAPIQSSPVVQICSHEKGKMQSVYRGSVFFILTFFLASTPLFKPGVATSFLPCCCWLAVFPLKTAGKQQQSSKPIRIWKEPGLAPTDHFMVKKIIKALKNIIQSLCTHSAFFLFYDHIFVMSTGFPAPEMTGCEI